MCGCHLLTWLTTQLLCCAACPAAPRASTDRQRPVLAACFIAPADKGQRSSTHLHTLGAMLAQGYEEPWSPPHIKSTSTLVSTRLHTPALFTHTKNKPSHAAGPVSLRLPPKPPKHAPTCSMRMRMPALTMAMSSSLRGACLNSFTYSYLCVKGSVTCVHACNALRFSPGAGRVRHWCSPLHAVTLWRRAGQCKHGHSTRPP